MCCRLAVTTLRLSGSLVGGKNLVHGGLSEMIAGSAAMRLTATGSPRVRLPLAAVSAGGRWRSLPAPCGVSLRCLLRCGDVVRAPIVRLRNPHTQIVKVEGLRRSPCPCQGRSGCLRAPSVLPRWSVRRRVSRACRSVRKAGYLAFETSTLGPGRRNARRETGDFPDMTRTCRSGLEPERGCGFGGSRKQGPIDSGTMSANAFSCTVP